MSTFEQAMAEAEAQRQAAEVAAFANAAVTLESAEVTYVLSSPVTIERDGQTYRVSRVKVTRFEDGGAEVEGYFVPLTAAGQPNKRKPAIWRWLPGQVVAQLEEGP